jgi:hypothetical protein
MFWLPRTLPELAHMKRSRVVSLGVGLLVVTGALHRINAGPDDPAPRGGALAALPPVANEANENGAIKPLAEGPLHEAFLSPARDNDPEYIEKAPPPPITERPGVDRPNPDAQWIEGYWEWDPTRKDFLWVTGTWRVPPPGKFWVNGFWKRTDQGWYRVAGFWSDRQTDRINFRKEGPPADRPNEDPGPAPGQDYFYVPGQWVPDKDGVAWKKGFWAKAQPGWAWVPSQWVKQPEGWVFQDGYWDRVLEDRGTLFTPAQVADQARNPNTVYQPLSQVAPESYGRLYGAFGRPYTYYDGYPGVYYDSDGRYYGYADYGNLNMYYGYLDYPYYGSYGYPYISGYSYPYYGGYGGYGGYGRYGGYNQPWYGYGGYGGLGLYGGLGYGCGLFNGMLGYGYGSPYYGGWGGWGGYGGGGGGWGGYGGWGGGWGG